MKNQSDELIPDVNSLKRHAVAQVFWPAGPADDDFCYDKIMSSASIDQSFQDENALFLFKSFKSIADNKGVQSFLEAKYNSLYSIVSDRNGLDIGKVKKAAVEHFFWTTHDQGADGGYDKILNSPDLNKSFLNQHNLFIHEPYDKLLDSAGLKKAISDEAVAIASLHPQFSPDLIEKFHMTKNSNTIINNAIEIAKIEAEVDTLCRLSELDLIDKDELDNRLGDAVVKFSDLYDKGGIDSKFCYDMARELSNKIEQADTGDGWWTLNFEDFSRGEKLTSGKVIAESLEKQEINRIRIERESKVYRVMVTGTKTTPVDDMQPLFGTFESSVQFETGAGANSISDALKIVKEFDAQNREKNKEFIIDEFERDVGYLTPSRFTIFDSAGKSVIGGVWENKIMHIPDDNLNQNMVDELNKEIKELEKQYDKEFRADNNDACRRVVEKMDLISIKLLNNDLAKIPPEENVRSEVSKFNYPVVYWGNDDLQHSTSHEGNIYYSLAAAESYYQAAEQCFKDANPDYDVSIYKLTNDKGYLSGCDIVLDDEAFNSLSLIKSSQSAARKTSDQQNEKPSDNFSVILEELATTNDAASERANSAHTSPVNNTSTPDLPVVAQTRQRSSLTN